MWRFIENIFFTLACLWLLFIAVALAFEVFVTVYCWFTGIPK